MDRKLWDLVLSTISLQADAISQCLSHLSAESFLSAVEKLAACQRIAASACGHSGIVCQHFVHLMCCIGKSARFIYPSEAVHGAMGFVQQGDVLLLASRGGKTAELEPILTVGRKRGATIIVVTENSESPLALQADIVLRIHVTREIDPFNSQGTTSVTVMSVLFDAIQRALIEKTNFELDSFATVHPGGAVGERLVGAQGSTHLPSSRS